MGVGGGLGGVGRRGVQPLLVALFFSFTDLSVEAIGRGGRANRQQSSRLFELSPHDSTKPDNIL